MNAKDQYKKNAISATSFRWNGKIGTANMEVFRENFILSVGKIFNQVPDWAPDKNVDWGFWVKSEFGSMFKPFLFKEDNHDVVIFESESGEQVHFHLDNTK